MSTHRPDPFSRYRRALHRTLHPAPSPKPHTRHGEDGQVFTETIYRPAATRSNLHDPIPDPFPSPHEGIPSLSYACRKILNHNFASLPLEALLAVPYYPIGRWLYRDAVVTRRDTLRAWCVFVVAYGAEFDAVEGDGRKEEVKEFRYEFLRDLPGEDIGRWMVHLELITGDIEERDIRGLGELQCLRELRLWAGKYEERECMDDNIVRGWIRSGRWMRVRCVGLFGYRRITERCWGYLYSLDGLKEVELESGISPGRGWRKWRERDGEEVHGQEIPRILEMKMMSLDEKKKKKDMLVQKWVKVEMTPKLDVKEEKKEIVTAAKKLPPVIRKRRLVDMGDLLGQFEPRKR
ncbi:hypothetical protein BZA77DRAFT_34730 [Pyronema omphalodes]|nr:hypothetical protein BZA77DRAFT_34730 [Pyronema omphalodes]